MLQIYYEAPEKEDLPPGVFGGRGIERSSWTQEQANSEQTRLWGHRPSAPSASSGQGKRSQGAASGRPPSPRDSDSASPGTEARLDELLREVEGEDGTVAGRAKRRSP